MLPHAAFLTVMTNTVCTRQNSPFYIRPAPTEVREHALAQKEVTVSQKMQTAIHPW